MRSRPKGEQQPSCKQQPSQQQRVLLLEEKRLNFGSILELDRCFGTECRVESFLLRKKGQTQMRHHQKAFIVEL